MEQHSQARWIIPLLIALVLASGAVVYWLLHLTSPEDANDAVSGTVSTQSLSSESLKTETTQMSAIPASSDGTELPPTDDTTDTSPPDTTSSTEPTTTVVPPPIERTLAGSHVVIPASWSGTATMTIDVLGDCATATPSVYSGLAADLAMDLTQNIASKAEAPLPDGVSGDAPVITLGINTGAVPFLGLYTSQITDDGSLGRFWDLTVSHGRSWTDVTGTLTNVSADSSNTNVLVDAETALQPCEPASTVSLPRALAAGATLSGHITADHASLTVHATTTDEQRAITVTITAAPTGSG